MVKCKHEDKDGNSLLKYENKVKGDYHLYRCEKCNEKVWLQDFRAYLKECEKEEEEKRKRLEGGGKNAVS